MKKILCLVLTLLFVFTMAVGCHDQQTSTTPKASSTSSTTKKTSATSSAPIVDVWNGSVATSFAGGSGTSTDPYRIKTGAQLAYVAKQVNSGASNFYGQFLKLENDLNLNNTAWTPIGNGTHSFAGTFDGAGYTISKLNITNPNYRMYDGEKYAYAGLFGSCTQSAIRNLKIQNATVNIPVSPITYEYVYAGILVGHINCIQRDSISNVRITNASITVTQKSAYLYAGGCAGYLAVKENSLFEASLLQCKDIQLTAKENTYYSYLGGLFGRMYIQGSVEFTNFASYCALKYPYNSGTNYGGAFGSIYKAKGHLKLENAWCVTASQSTYSASNTHANRTEAIIGVYSQESNQGDTLVLRNLYGHVKPHPSGATFSSPVYSLYFIPASNYTEQNCEGCFSLPANQGLDPLVWDLRVWQEPVLK